MRASEVPSCCLFFRISEVAMDALNRCSEKARLTFDALWIDVASTVCLLIRLKREAS